MATRGHWKAAGRGGVVADFAAVAGTLGHDLAGSLLAALELDQPDIWGGLWKLGLSTKFRSGHARRNRPPIIGQQQSVLENS